MEQTASVRKVRIIPATKPAPASGPRHSGRQRVAAYCRVSTDSEEQLNSYAAQKNYYTQKIEENPDWEMAGIFADEGITGTSMKKRAEFNRMIAACKRGAHRHDPDQVRLPVCPEHGGLSESDPHPQSQRHRCDF